MTAFAAAAGHHRVQHVPAKPPTFADFPPVPLPSRSAHTTSATLPTSHSSPPSPPACSCTLVYPWAAANPQRRT
eukprot:3520550-Prymnesium_polylepis.1